MNLSDMRAALDAFERDGVVECRDKYVNNAKWLKSSLPHWNFERYDFCPVQKPRECWRVEYSDGGLGNSAFAMKEGAEAYLGCVRVNRIVRFREVMEDE